MADLPIVCTLTPGDLNARAATLLPGVAAAAARRRAVENGYVLEFSASSEALGAIAAMIDAERQCCRFLRFQLTVAPDGGPVTLEMTGPPGAQPFLAALIEQS